jgi:hypothetical protein
VYTTSTGMVTISGGTVSATTGTAVFNLGGDLFVLGTALITSANTNTSQGTIRSQNKLEMTGGTVKNTSDTTANAIFNSSYASATITGGTVLKAGDGNYAVYNYTGGTVTISPRAEIVGHNYGVP